MANYKSNELFGAADKLLDFISTNNGELGAKGITVASLTAAVTNARTPTVGAETNQEGLKQQLKAATAAYELAAQNLYDILTSVTDVCAGALGKKTAKGKQVLEIRKQLNKSRSGGGSVNPGTSGGI